MVPLIGLRYAALRTVERYYSLREELLTYPDSPGREQSLEDDANDFREEIEDLYRAGLTTYDYLYAFLTVNSVLVERSLERIGADLASVEQELRWNDQALKNLRKQKRLLLGELSGAVYRRSGHGDTIYEMSKRSGFSDSRIKKMVR